MPEVQRVRRPPRGVARLFYRFPILLYRAGLGWLLGGRFLLLEHVGRRSGRPRRAVLEVARYDRQRDAYLVFSAWGKRSDWYRNLQAGPQVTIQAGRKRMAAQAQFLSEEENLAELRSYAQRYPRATQALMSMIGLSYSGESDLPVLSQELRGVRLQVLER